MSQDVCSTGISGSVSTLGIGVSGGKHIRDLNCERIKLSKVLFDFNMKIAAVSLLCQDERVYMAMKSAGTPCPWDGKIGPDAQAMWDKYPELRPDYDEFLVKAEVMARVDKEIAMEKARLQAEKDGELAELTGTSDPLVVEVFVVVDVVVFVCPSLLLVVVDVYPPVIWVLLPEVLVWSLSSFVESPHTGKLIITIKLNTNASSKVFFINLYSIFLLLLKPTFQMPFCLYLF